MSDVTQHHDGDITSLSAAMADCLARHATAEADAVRRAVARLTADRANGHTCLDLTSLDGDVQDWITRLDASGVVTRDISEVGLPLLRSENLLRFTRDARAESAIAARWWQAQREDSDPLDPDLLTPLMQQYFPQAASQVDWQALAALTVLQHRLSVISGGPGTGKTTTVVRVLALLLAREPTLRIGLCAPTGKAAARLAESIQTGLEKLAAEPAIRAAIPAQALTLHRLLGYNPSRNTFRHSARLPLPFDVLIVDELSMADVLLVNALFTAMPAQGRLVLLGDPDQLASVEAGYVLSDCCRVANDAVPASLVSAAQSLGLAAPEITPEASPLSSLVVRLRHTYRFAGQPGIAAFADSIRRGDADALRAAVNAEHPDLRVVHHEAGAAAAFAELVPLAVAATQAKEPQHALAALNDIRILAATRSGTWGARHLDAVFEHLVQQHGGVPGRGRPILITANDPHLGLANGDIGVTWRDESGDYVCFVSGDSLRRLAPTRLPPHESAWAMTVHKAQGSEYARVVVALPPEPGPWLGRELLYTAVTRARKHVTVVATTEHILQCAGHSAQRSTGLARLLQP